MLGTLNRAQIDNLLVSQVHGRLGFTDNGKTYIIPLTYAYDGECIHVHTVEGQKINAMRRDPNVCFQVEQIDDMAHWQCAILWGIYEELKDDEAEDSLQLLINRVHPLMTSDTCRPKHGLDKQRHSRGSKSPVTFRIRVENASGRFEKRVNY